MINNSYIENKSHKFLKPFEEITDIIGNRISFSNSDRELHGRDESYHKDFKPDAVAFVIQLMKSVKF